MAQPLSDIRNESRQEVIISNAKLCLASLIKPDAKIEDLEHCIDLYLDPLLQLAELQKEELRLYRKLLNKYNLLIDLDSHYNGSNS